MPSDTAAFKTIRVEQIAMSSRGAIKIGPFGSQLRKEEMVSDGVKVYGQENVILGNWRVGDRRIRHSKYIALSSCEMKAGDVVLTMMGTIGRCAVFPEGAELGIMDSHLLRIQADPNIIDRSFLGTVLSSERVVGRQVDRLSHGSIMAGLSSAIVRRLELPLPPISEQRRIAGILDTLDETIRKSEQVIAKLQQMKQGLLHDLLTRGIDDNGELRDHERHPKKFSDSKLGRMPKDWQISTIGELIRITGGVIQTGPFGSQLHAEEYVDIGVPVVMPQNIRDDVIDLTNIALITWRKARELARHFLRLGDAIFARRGDLTKCSAIHEREIGWLCGTGCLLVRVAPETMLADWFTAIYRHDIGQRQVLARAVGSTMVNLNGSILANFLVPLPPLQEQIHFVEREESLRQRLTTEQAELTKLRTIKHGLLDDLLTGRVRVTPDESQ